MPNLNQPKPKFLNCTCPAFSSCKPENKPFLGTKLFLIKPIGYWIGIISLSGYDKIFLVIDGQPTVPKCVMISL